MKGNLRYTDLCLLIGSSVNRGTVRKSSLGVNVACFILADLRCVSCLICSQVLRVQYLEVGQNISRRLLRKLCVLYLFSTHKRSSVSCF